VKRWKERQWDRERDRPWVDCKRWW